MKKLILCLIASFFALSMWGAQATLPAGTTIFFCMDDGYGHNWMVDNAVFVINFFDGENGENYKDHVLAQKIGSTKYYAAQIPGRADNATAIQISRRDPNYSGDNGIWNDASQWNYSAKATFASRANDSQNMVSVSGIAGCNACDNCTLNWLEYAPQFQASWIDNWAMKDMTHGSGLTVYQYNAGRMQSGTDYQFIMQNKTHGAESVWYNYSTVTSTCSSNISLHQFSEDYKNITFSLTEACDVMITITLVGIGANVHVEATPVNLCSGAFAASSGNAAAGADGNTGSRWESDHTDNQVWQMNLNEAMTFDHVKIIWEGAYGKSFDILAGDACDNMTVIKSIRNQELAGFPYTQIIDLGRSVTARHIRFQGIARGTVYGYSFWEFEPYTAVVPVLTTLELSAASQICKTGQDVQLTARTKDQYGADIAETVSYSVSPVEAGSVNASGLYTASVKGAATITATAGPLQQSVTIFNYEGDNLAESTSLLTSKIIAQSAENPDGSDKDAFYAIDPNDGSVWQGSATGNTQDDEASRTYDSWFVVDLGDTYDIDLVMIGFEGACSQNYTLDFSADNSNWVNGYTYNGSYGTNGHTDYIYVGSSKNLTNNTGVRYVRFWSTKAATQYGMKMYYFKVFGTAGAKEPLPAPVNVAVNSTTNVITFDAVDGADAYTAKVYNGSDELVASQPVASGDALTYAPWGSANFTVTVVASGAGYRPSPESDGATWHYTFVMPASIWCETAGVVTDKSKNWGDAHFTINTLAGGNVTIVITSPDGTAARYRNAKGMNGTFKLNGTAAEFDTYFTGSKTSDDTFTLTLIDPANKPAIGSVIDYSGQIECATSQHGDDYSDYEILGYFYGTTCPVTTANVSVAVTPVSSGTVTINGEEVNGKRVDLGSDVIFEATPAEHYSFVKWDDEITTNPRTIQDIQADVTLTAIFERSEYVMTATSNDVAMGTASVAGLVVPGAPATFTATPKEGYLFINWTNVGGEEVSAENPYVVAEASEDLSLTANFRAIKDVYCNTEVEENGHVAYVTIRKTNTNEYKMLVTSSEVMTSPGNAYFQTSAGSTNISQEGRTVVSADGHLMTTTLSSTTDIYMNTPLYVNIQGAEEVHFPQITNIEFAIACESEDPVLSAPVVTDLTETSVRIRMSATDDWHVVKYTISGLGADAVLYGMSGAEVVYDAEGLTTNHEYSVTITAEDIDGKVHQRALNITPTMDVTAPTNFNADTQTISDTKIDLIVSAEEDRVSDITYSVTATPSVVVADQTFASGEEGTISVTGLTPGTSYSFTIRATNATGLYVEKVVNGVTSSDVPTTAPTAPYRNDADVISLYSDVFVPAIELNNKKDWNGVGTLTEMNIDGDNLLSYKDIVWWGWTFNVKDAYKGEHSGIDASGKGMEYLHVDLWSPQDGSVRFVPIWGGTDLTTNDRYYADLALQANTWKSYDIPLADGFTGTPHDFTSIFQMKFDLLTTGNLAVDNVYFYKSHPAATFPVSATAGVGGTAAVKKDGFNVVLAENGETGIQFIATPADGYRFVNWTNAGGDGVSTDATYSPASITAETHLTANFQKIYAVSAASSNVEMGTATVTYTSGGTPASTVDAGTSVTFTAIPEDGHVFLGWSNGSTANPYVVASVEEDITLTANFDYGRTVYCETPILTNSGNYTFKLSLGGTGVDGEYMFMVEGTTESPILGINLANTSILHTTRGGDRFTLANGGWTFDSRGNGAAKAVFRVADGYTWRDLCINDVALYLKTKNGEDQISTNFPACTTIDWSNVCADTEAPELEEPKYDVYSETSVRLSLKATDDRDFICYIITGFDGDPIVINAASGVREYYTVSDMEPNYPYRVTVVASDKAGNEDSKVITVTASPDATAPFNVKANAMALSMTDILITASADEDRTSDITYNIYNEDGTQLLATCYAAPGATATHKFSGLTPETPYTYKVAALNFAGVEATPRITVSATTYNEDLALNKLASAGLGHTSGNISLANNGNYKQAWSSNDGARLDISKDWWKVDLGSECVIDNIRILWEQAYPGDYVLQVSNSETAWNSTDNSNTDWTTVRSYNVAPKKFATGGIINTINKDDYMTDYHDFAVRAKGRYVRIKVLSATGAYDGGIYGICMYTFEVYGRSSLSGGANITSAVQAGVTTNSATLNVTLASYDPANDYIIVMDPTNGINQRCKIVEVVEDVYDANHVKTGTVTKKQITVTGLNVNTTYNFQLIAVDVEGKESVVYPNTGYVTIKTLNAAPVIGQAPLPPFRNGRDFRSIYSDFYKSALKNPDGFSRAKWINVSVVEEDVNDDYHIVYGYNGNNRESVWGDIGGPEAFIARDGSDPLFPELNYTDGANTGLDAHEFTNLHIDLWLQGTTSTPLIVRVNDDPLTSLDGIAAASNVESGNGHWYSYDIAITPAMVTSLGATLTNLRWMKFQFPADFNSDYWALDNVYFYKDVNYDGYHEVRVKANLKDAGKPYIVGVDYEDVYFAQPEEKLTLRAHSAEDRGFFFVNWTNDDNNDAEISDKDPTVNVTVTSPIHYTANYIRKYKVVGIAKEIGGETTGTVNVVLSDASPNVVDGFKFVTPGTNATFTATQNSPYVFKYWALDGKFYSAGANDGSHTVVYENIQRDIELRAIYDKGGTAYKSTRIPTGFPDTASVDGHLRVSYISLGDNRYRILVEGTPECCLTAAYNNFNFYVHNINGGRGGDDGRSFPASAWNENFFPYGYGYTYVDFEATDPNLIKIDADRNYVVFYRTPIAEGQSHSGRDLVECKLPAMGIDWYNEYRPTFPLAAKEANEGEGITWSTATWFNTEGTLGTPNDNTDVFLLSPTTVDVATARAKSVTICTEHDGYLTGHGVVQGLVDDALKPNFAPQKHNGHLTINADAALQVVGKVQKVERANFYNPAPTTPADLYLASGAAASNYKHATLIHGDTEGNTGATVEFHSASSGAPNDCKWQWMAIPFGDKVALPEYYSAWIRSYHDGAWYEDVTNETVMQAFQGYELTQRTEHLGYPYILTGNLTSTANHALTLHNGLNLIGNSWSAPINISRFNVDAFNAIGAEASIVMINTGLDDGGVNAVHVQTAASSSDNRTAGEYVAVPICVAQYLNDAVKVIPPMQSFQIYSPAGGSLTLNYNDLVRTSGAVNVQANRAPQRSVAEPDTLTNRLRIYVEGETDGDYIYLFQNEEATDGFDNGWDARKMDLQNPAASALASSSASTLWQISTKPMLNGTMLMFKPGVDDTYRVGFDYTGEETLWLYDMMTQEYTAINNETTYQFAPIGTFWMPRFLITDYNPNAQMPGVTTDIVNIEECMNGLVISNTAHQQMIVRVFDMSGRLFSEMQTSAPMYEVALPTDGVVYTIQVSVGNDMMVRKVVR